MLALLAPFAAADADAQRARHEEEVMQRMLMLQHRSLFGDRPLPLSSTDSSHEATAPACHGGELPGLRLGHAAISGRDAAAMPPTPRS